MAPQECEIAEEEDSRNKGPRNGVEMSFKNIVLKLTHTDYYPQSLCTTEWALLLAIFAAAVGLTSTIL